MTTCTKHPLYLALAGLGTIGATGAQAVNVSGDGRGQVLLYPYYTTRGPRDFLARNPGSIGP